jgi:hypothetical protein
MMYQYCKKGAAAVGEPSGRVAAEGPEGPPMVPPPGSRQGAGSKIFQTARFERFAFFYKHVRRRGAAKGPGAKSFKRRGYDDYGSMIRTIELHPKCLERKWVRHDVV